MRVRVTLILVAVALAAAAVLAERLLRSDAPSIRSGDAIRDGTGTAPRADEPQDFAILEMAVDETQDPNAPFVGVVFALEVRDPVAGVSRFDVEPMQSGIASFGPIRPGAEVRVSVVSAGPRWGFDTEETIGEAGLVLPARGGRSFLVVPTRPSHVASPATRKRFLVVDDGFWPVAGALVSVPGGDAGLRTSAGGFCVIDTPAGPSDVTVAPPPDRPELGPSTSALHPQRPDDLVVLTTQNRRDVVVDLLTADRRAESVDRVVLRALDARAWVRDWSVGPDGRLASVPLGRYTASWVAGGARREGLLAVGATGVTFERTPAPSATVVVTGASEPAGEAPETFLLVERSPRSSQLPSYFTPMSGFDVADGRGLTQWSQSSEAGAEGLPTFTGVPPGCYEVFPERDGRSRRACVEVPAAPAGARRVTVPAGPQDGRIRGSLRGTDVRNRWIIEARALGQFSVTRTLRVGEQYEFEGLSPGIYSLWATRADAGLSAAPGATLPRSRWKNVVVEAAGRVTLDFEVR